MTATVGIQSEQGHNGHTAKHNSRKFQVTKRIDVPLPIQLCPAFRCRILVLSGKCLIEISPMHNGATPWQENGNKKLNG